LDTVDDQERASDKQVMLGPAEDVMITIDWTTDSVERIWYVFEDTYEGRIKSAKVA
jgi:hypothetical protein